MIAKLKLDKLVSRVARTHNTDLAIWLVNYSKQSELQKLNFSILLNILW